MKNKHRNHRTKFVITEWTAFDLPVLTNEVRLFLAEILPVVLRKFPGSQIVAKIIWKDHMHLLMIIPSKHSVQKVADHIRCETCKKMKERFPDMVGKFPDVRDELPIEEDTICHYPCIWSWEFKRSALSDQQFEMKRLEIQRLNAEHAKASQPDAR